MEQELNKIGKDIIGAAYAVHNFFGRFLLEKVYEEALAIELRAMGYEVKTQVPIQILYKGISLPSDAYRADLVVNSSVIVEIKALSRMNRDCVRQLLSYLKLDNKKLGYLINFGAKSLTCGNLKEDEILNHGIYRLVNNF